MIFKNINTRADAFEYAEKIGGVPKVPFSIFWEFYPEDEDKVTEAARQVQEVFNMVQSSEPFKIEMIEEIEDDLFDIEINPGGIIPFKIGQNKLGQRRTAKKIDEQLDAHQKKKKQNVSSKDEEQIDASEKEEQKAPKKRRKSSDELYDEFKSREEKILNEIRASALIKAKAELEAVKAELEAAKAEKAEVEKAEAKKVEAKKVEAKVEAKVVAKTTSLKLFGYTVFEYSR